MLCPIKAHPTMTPPNTRPPHSVLGCVLVRPRLTALRGQYTTLPPISPGWAKTAHLPSRSTAAIKSQKSFRLLDQVSGRSFNDPRRPCLPLARQHLCLKVRFLRNFRDLLSKSVGKVDLPIRPCFFVDREEQRHQIQPITR